MLTNLGDMQPPFKLDDAFSVKIFLQKNSSGLFRMPFHLRKR